MTRLLAYLDAPVASRRPILPVCWHTAAVNTRRLLVPAIAVFAVLGVTGAAAPYGDRDEAGVIAEHNGTERNLKTDGWGTATTCVADRPGEARCYDTVEDLERDEGLADHSHPAEDAERSW